MKILFWIGLVVLILGVASLVVPLPDNQQEGIAIGGVSIGVESQSSEKISPIVGGIMILAGAGMMIAGKSRS